MLIILKSGDKPSLTIELGRAGHGAAGSGSALHALDWENVRCASCRFGEGIESCATVRSCSSIFSYFCDIVSCNPAEATLSRGEDLLRFSGSVQCVAAFAILASMVYSECGRAAPFAFLLERFYRIQGHTAGTPFFGKARSCLDRQGLGKTARPDRESWHELFDSLLRRKMVSVLGLYDNGGLNDTLRNACQILYSISSLALEECREGPEQRRSPAGQADPDPT